MRRRAGSRRRWGAAAWTALLLAAPAHGQMSQVSGAQLSAAAGSPNARTVMREVEQARRELQTNGKSAGAWLRLGQALAASGAAQPARAALRTALKLNPRLCRGWLLAGELGAGAGRWAAAAKDDLRAARCEPGLASAHFFAAEALLRLGALPRATTQFHAALQGGGGGLGRFCAGDARPEGCGPAAMFVHVGLGQIASQLGHPAAAAAEFRAALALGPAYPPALLGLADGDLRRGQARRAEALFRRALAAQPSSVAALAGLAAALRAAGRPAEAQQAFARLRARIQARKARLRAEQETDRGMTLWHAGQLQAAAAAFRRAAAAAPGYAAAHNDLGSVLALSGDARDAVRQFALAVRLRRPYPKARSNWGLVLLAQGRAAAAARQFRAALAAAPLDVGARLNLAAALERQGKKGAAETALRQVIALAPAMGKAHVALGMLLARSHGGLTQPARWEIETGLRLDPALRRLLPRRIQLQLAATARHVRR